MLKLLRRFRNEENGSMSVELVLVVPVLTWALLSTLVYFDTFRAEAISTRATLTLADMYSRETDVITPGYLNSTRSVLRVLTSAEDNPDFRVTVYRYEESTDRFRVVWSRNRGLSPNRNNARLAEVADQLPMMADGDRAILLETRTEYEPPFSVGLGILPGTNLETLEFETLITISPRFVETLCWEQNSTAIPVC